MKEIKLYQCEKCGTQYNDRNRAKECEKAHIDIVGIKDARCSSEQKYPNKIEVKFADGKTHWYSL